MAGWDLKSGALTEYVVSEDRIWSLFNYVFSDSLKVSESLAKDLRLPKEVIGHTFADASKILNQFLKDVDLVAYDTDGKVVDVEIVPKKVTAKVTITSPSKEVPIKIVPKGDLATGKSIQSTDFY